jgi:hypothetical protein
VAAAVRRPSEGSTDWHERSEQEPAGAKRMPATQTRPDSNGPCATQMRR